MRQKNVILILVLLGNMLPIASFSQNYEIIYHRINTPRVSQNTPNDNPALTAALKKSAEMRNNTIFEFELLAVNGRSMYEFKRTRLKNDLEKESTIKLTTQNVYKDLNASEFIILPDAPNGEGAKDNFSNTFNWKFLEGSRQIGRFTCKKAVSQNYPDVVVWYCPDFPTVDGPDIYGGLPGLVLRVERKGFSIEATEVKIMKQTSEKIIPPVLSKTVTYKEFLTGRLSAGKEAVLQGIKNKKE